MKKPKKPKLTEYKEVIKHTDSGSMTVATLLDWAKSEGMSEFATLDHNCYDASWILSENICYKKKQVEERELQYKADLKAYRQYQIQKKEEELNKLKEELNG